MACSTRPNAIPARERIRSTTRWTRTARPVWSILSQAGYRTHAFGWPASHPAEPINGVAVSDLFAEHDDENSIYPQRLRRPCSGCDFAPRYRRRQPADPPSRAAELNPACDQRLYLLAQFLASTASLHAAATWALEHEAWDFAAVRYDGLAHLVAAFGGAYTAAQAGASGDDADIFGAVIPNAYRFFDMLLGRLLALAGPDASVMLVSQHGGASQLATSPQAPKRPNPGILVASGPAFKPNRQLDSASVCDAAPPSSVCLDGRPSRELMAALGVRC